MKELIDKLKILGFNELECKVYIILLQNQYFTASEISKSAKINRTQIYDILAKLIQRGICTEILGSVKKYTAVEPEKMLEIFEKEIEAKKSTINELYPYLQKIYQQNNEKEDPLDFVKVLRTNKNIHENVMQLVRSARESVLVFNKPPYAMSPHQNDEEIKSLEQGISHKCVYEVEGNNLSDFIARLRYFSQAGEQIRIVPELPLKMIIIDSSFVIFNMQHNSFSGPHFTAMMIENSDLAKLLIKTFHIFWQEGKTIDELIST